VAIEHKESDVHSDFKVSVAGQVIISKVDDQSVFDWHVAEPDVMPLKRPLPGMKRGSPQADGAFRVRDAIAKVYKEMSEKA